MLETGYKSPWRLSSPSLCHTGGGFGVSDLWMFGGGGGGGVNPAGAIRGRELSPGLQEHEEENAVERVRSGSNRGELRVTLFQLRNRGMTSC